MSSRWWFRTILAATLLPLVSCVPEEELEVEVIKAAAVDRDETTDLRHRMVAAIAAESRGVDGRVLTAMRRVPRHHFVPNAPLAVAYEWDRPYRIGEGQTISSAEIVALMTSRLELKGTEKVLEIGTGSGYQAAILSELVASVFSIEILPSLGRKAQARLERMGYRNVEVRIGDGYLGWPEEAPFDAIIVTAAPPKTPPALLEQLAPGGRLIVPVGGQNEIQRLTLYRKDVDGTIQVKTGIPVRFVPMVHGEDR